MTIYYPMSSYLGYQIFEPDDPEKMWLIKKPNGDQISIEAKGEDDCRLWIDLWIQPKIGQEVIVTPKEYPGGFYPPHEFRGRILSCSHGLITVIDQDDNVFNVDLDQVETLEGGRVG